MRLKRFLRLVVALTWLYQGLWLKLVVVDPHHLEVVRGAGLPGWFLTVIGAGETLLGIGVLSGLFNRFVSWFQLALLLAMNSIGILTGGVDDPVGLILGNLPLVGCILVLLNE